MSKKRSGAEFRKLKKKQEEERKQLASTWHKWLNKGKNSDAGCSSSTTFTEEKDYSVQDNESIVIMNRNRKLKNRNHFLQRLLLQITLLPWKMKLPMKKNYWILNFDPAIWQRPYSHSLIAALVKRGPEQGTNADLKSMVIDWRLFKFPGYHINLIILYIIKDSVALSVYLSVCSR